MSMAPFILLCCGVFGRGFCAISAAGGPFAAIQRVTQRGIGVPHCEQRYCPGAAVASMAAVQSLACRLLVSYRTLA